ncbi:MAG: inverse autotransporter beta domain-containing protein [Candidatus Omnitrophica bacterium]|nr:inverse autotransporter beta domain-containing protein [Candidatus Omnitrophota bacterium]
MIYRFVLAGAFIFLALWFRPAFAGTSLFYKEVNLVGGYSNLNKWVDAWGEQTSSVGFEHLSKFANDYGDFLTTDLQVRFAYDSKENSKDAWGVQIHNAWLRYKLDSINKIKVGHLDVPFGLNPVVDVHSTLLQTLAPNDIGFVKDWGTALESSFSKFDTSIALQLGSGMSIYRRDGSFLLSGRLGTPQGGNAQAGLSFMYGKTLETTGMNTIPRNELISNTATRKKRIGLDGQYLFGPLLTKAEIDFGKNSRTDVRGYFIEMDYTIPKLQNLELELQYKNWQNNMHDRSMDDSAVTLGLSYKLNSKVTLRGSFADDLNRMGKDEDRVFLLQFYFYG